MGVRSAPGVVVTRAIHLTHDNVAETRMHAALVGAQQREPTGGFFRHTRHAINTACESLCKTVQNDGQLLKTTLTYSHSHSHTQITCKLEHQHA